MTGFYSNAFMESNNPKSASAIVLRCLSISNTKQNEQTARRRHTTNNIILITDRQANDNRYCDNDNIKFIIIQNNFN